MTAFRTCFSFWPPHNFYGTPLTGPLLPSVCCVIFRVLTGQCSLYFPTQTSPRASLISLPSSPCPVMRNLCTRSSWRSPQPVETVLCPWATPELRTGHCHLPIRVLCMGCGQLEGTSALGWLIHLICLTQTQHTFC